MALFAKIFEWQDDSKDTLVYRYPMKNGGSEVNNKSKLIVRESQKAIFVYKGEICDVFEPGTYSLGTEIFPILSKLAGWRYGFQTPIKVDIYFINTKQFTGCKWGTANPIIMRDAEFGNVRVRGYGSYSFKVNDVEIFLKELFGTNSTFKTSDIVDWLKTIIVSNMADAFGESKISILDIAGNTNEFGEIITAKIQKLFEKIGLKLVNFLIENVSVPEEVEKALDEKTKYGILGSATDTMMKVAAAEAMKDAAKNPSGGGMIGAGVGIGAGLGIGEVFADAFKSSKSNNNSNNGEQASSGRTCPECGASVGSKAKFCPECGKPLPQGKFCPECGAKITVSAKFCPECGKKL